jgi:hypothetical protein
MPLPVSLHNVNYGASGHPAETGLNIEQTALIEDGCIPKTDQ